MAHNEVTNPEGAAADSAAPASSATFVAEQIFNALSAA